MPNTKFVSVSLSLLLFTGCTEAVEPPAHDDVLADAAAELAAVLDDPQLRAELRAALAARATGDYEVTLERAREVHLGDGRTLHDVLSLLDGVAALPHLQVAAPLGVDAWTDDVIPRVTFVADEDAETLDYVAADGSVVTLPADQVPDFPVLVIGTHERIDRDDVGAVKPEDELALATSVPFHLRSIMITDTKEPWTKGDPEIYIKCRTDTRSFSKQWVDQADDTLVWYVLNRHVATLGDAESVVTCDVKESDGGSGDDDVGYAVFMRDDLPWTTGLYCQFEGGQDAHLGAADTAATTQSGPFGPIPRHCSNEPW
jgi:hypothetical protein